MPWDDSELGKTVAAVLDSLQKNPVGDGENPIMTGTPLGDLVIFAEQQATKDDEIHPEKKPSLSNC